MQNEQWNVQRDSEGDIVLNSSDIEILGSFSEPGNPEKRLILLIRLKTPYIDFLRNIKYKEASYPFDWNVTQLSFIIKCFEDNFQNFTDNFDNCKSLFQLFISEKGFKHRAENSWLWERFPYYQIYFINKIIDE